MWTPATREQHRHDGLRYSNDLTDTEWDVIAPRPCRKLCDRLQTAPHRSEFYAS